MSLFTNDTRFVVYMDSHAAQPSYALNGKKNLLLLSYAVGLVCGTPATPDFMNLVTLSSIGNQFFQQFVLRIKGNQHH